MDLKNSLLDLFCLAGAFRQKSSGQLGWSTLSQKTIVLPLEMGPFARTPIGDEIVEAQDGNIQTD
jgi:hypothetical protein